MWGAWRRVGRCIPPAKSGCTYGFEAIVLAPVPKVMERLYHSGRRLIKKDILVNTVEIASTHKRFSQRSYND